MTASRRKESVKHQFIREWVSALESGEYKQGRDLLRSRQERYCCLGVAVEVARKMELIDGDWESGIYVDVEHQSEVFCDDGDCPRRAVPCYGFPETNTDSPSSTTTQTLPKKMLELFDFRMDESGAFFDSSGQVTELVFKEHNPKIAKKFFGLAAANDAGIPFTAIAARLRELFADSFLPFNAMPENES